MPSLRVWGLLLSLFLFLSFLAPNVPPLPPEPIYPQGYFRSPVLHNINLSATFGELRSNHFHAGLDIKPLRKGVAGDPILATAEGYVSRIKIAGGGYGNAIYITHPNGYTTVYGHLDAYAYPFDTLIKAEQYRRQSFELDWNLPQNLAPVTQGQQIGQMGNTGGSQGVHLHYEIRDAATDEPINPLLFGVSVTDNVRPDIRQLRIFLLNEARETDHRINVPVTKKATGAYKVAKDTVYVAQNTVGLGLKAYDATSSNGNEDGVYRIKLLVDGQPAHTFTASRFSFDDTRYLNAHLDYEDFVRNKAYWNRSYVLPGNRLRYMYSDLSNNGVIYVAADSATEITYIVEDYFGNSSTLQFWLAYKPTALPMPDRNFQYILPTGEPSAIVNGELRLYFPAEALYESLFLKYFSTNERVSDAYSSVHHIHDKYATLHKAMEVGIKPTREIPDSLRSKTFIALCSGSDTYNYGGAWEGESIKTFADQFGDFCVMIDTIAPRITPISFIANGINARRMSFKIADNYPTKGRATEGLRYAGYIDDEWVLFEYENKGNTLYHDFDYRVGQGDHLLRLEVTDNRGNKRIFESPFKH